jgi:hypothetical protein
MRGIVEVHLLYGWRELVVEDRLTSDGWVHYGLECQMARDGRGYSTQAIARGWSDHE